MSEPSERIKKLRGLNARAFADGLKPNEPWATDGKASADKIEILQVFDTRTGEDVTERFRRGNNKNAE